MANNKNKSTKKFPVIYIVAGILVLITIGSFLVKGINTPKETVKAGGETKKAELSDNGDLVISLEDVSEKATFYSYDADGTKLEVMAIKASDGTIRTAFNTCQVCFSSGRGYYDQDGDQLVCQNCGNRFSADDVEVTRGGCNPIPIGETDKTVDDTTITISKDYLKSAKEIFENWKL